MNKLTFTADGLREEVVAALREMMKMGHPPERTAAAQMLLDLADDIDHEAWEKALGEETAK